MAACPCSFAANNITNHITANSPTFNSKTTSKEARAQYIVDNFANYFNEDLSQFNRTDIVIYSGEENGVSFAEMHSLCTAIYPRIGLILDEEGQPIGHTTPHKPEYHVHFAIVPDLGDDLFVRLLCCINR